MPQVLRDANIPLATCEKLCNPTVTLIISLDKGQWYIIIIQPHLKSILSASGRGLRWGKRKRQFHSAVVVIATAGAGY